MVAFFVAVQFKNKIQMQPKRGLGVLGVAALRSPKGIQPLQGKYLVRSDSVRPKGCRFLCSLHLTYPLSYYMRTDTNTIYICKK